MPRCYTCGTSFKRSVFNNSNKCEDCLDDEVLLQDDTDVELKLLTNPSGKTKPVFYDEPEDE